MSRDNRNHSAASHSNWVFSILSVEYNRYVLQYFQESAGQVASMEELAEYVATRESKSGCVLSHSEESGRSNPDRVAIRLAHATLPKLADAGVVDYDRRHHTVRYRGHQQMEPYLELITETTGTEADD